MPTVRVKHHMTGSKLLGTGGSEYVALETAIGLAKHGFKACLDAILLNYIAKYPRGELYRIARFYGIPDQEVDLVDICRGGGSITINVSGDFLSGHANIIYFHFPSNLKPETYYAGLPIYMRVPSYLYYLVNRLAVKSLVRKSSLILANSVKTALYIHRSIGVKPHVLHPPVNISDIASKPPLPRRDRGKYVLIVSRISYEKQPYNVLYVAKALRELGLNDWKIIYAGATAKFSDRIIGRIMEIASRYGLEKFIVFEKNVAREKLVEYYRRAYMYVHLTEKEHFGITIIEAMASGTPVVIPRTASSWIDIARGDESIAMPYSDYATLKHSIKILARDEGLWGRLSRSAWRRGLSFSRKYFHSEIAKYVSHVARILNTD